MNGFGGGVVAKRKSLDFRFHSNTVFLIVGCREGGDSKMLPTTTCLLYLRSLLQ